MQDKVAAARKTRTKKVRVVPQTHPLRTIAGKISDDGKSFTADKDGKQWTLKNPEDVKGHEGHHVKVQAHVYTETNELHVVNVTMINQKAGKKTKASSKPS